MGEAVLYTLAFAAAALAPYGFWFLMRGFRAPADDWPSAAAACGLVLLHGNRVWQRTVVAESDRVRVTIKAMGGDQERAYSEIVVTRRDRSLRSLSIRLPALAHLAPESASSGDVATGDHGFDRAATLLGPATHLLAALDAATRARLISLARTGPVQVIGGEVRVTIAEAQLETARRRFLESLLAISDRLFGKLDAAAELARNACEDPHAGAREQSLSELARGFRDEPGTHETLRRALADRAPSVQISAARELGEEGRAFLLQVLEDSGATDADVAAAIRALGMHLGPERVDPILKSALRARRSATAAACIERLGAGDIADAVATLGRILRVDRGPLAIAAAGALGRLSDVAAEARLVEALATAAGDVVLAVVEALERCATVAAISPLRAAAERSRNAPGLQAAVRRAIAAIQARVPGAERGQLSLAPALGGSISLAPEQSGQLSLADDPAGRISGADPPSERK